MTALFCAGLTGVVQRHDAGGGLGRVVPSPRSGGVQGPRPCRTHWGPMLKCALGPFGPAGEPSLSGEYGGVPL